MCRVRVKVRVRDVSIQHPIEDFQNDLDLGPADLSPDIFMDGFLQELQASTAMLLQQFQAATGVLSPQAHVALYGPTQQAQAAAGGIFHPPTGTAVFVQPQANSGGLAQSPANTGASQLPLAGGLFQLLQAGTGGSGLPQQSQESTVGIPQSDLTGTLVHAVQQSTTTASQVMYQALVATLAGIPEQPETNTGEISQQPQMSAGGPTQLLEAAVDELTQVLSETSELSEQFDVFFGQPPLGVFFAQPQAGAGGTSQLSQSSMGIISQQPQSSAGMSQQPQSSAGMSQQPQSSTGMSQQPQSSMGSISQQPQSSMDIISQQPQSSTGSISQHPQVAMDGSVPQFEPNELEWVTLL